jgi:hypothetical protein
MTDTFGIAGGNHDALRYSEAEPGRGNGREFGIRPRVEVASINPTTLAVIGASR